jgi:hypothetical protein
MGLLLNMLQVGPDLEVAVEKDDEAAMEGLVNVMNLCCTCPVCHVTVT